MKTILKRPNMRPLLPYPKLRNITAQRLRRETLKVASASDPKRTSEIQWKRVRKRKWFGGEVISLLKALVGPGEPCMWCDCSTCTDVDHYKPKSVFPLEAFVWENYLWSCSECNRFKGDQFPPDAQFDVSILHPLQCNVWDHFYIDRFGNLNPVWNTLMATLDAQAVTTAKILKLDRDTLQIRRQKRLKELKLFVVDTLALYDSGQLSIQDINERIEHWATAPFQPDVSGFFLRGPGRKEPPFQKLFDLKGIV